MFEIAMDTHEFDLDFSEDMRIPYIPSEDTSFFSNNTSLPSSPRPCPISPCGSSMSSLLMEDDFVDINTFISKKPYSPARKRLNMDALAFSPSKSAIERPLLQSINENVMRVTSSGAFKRTECSLESLSPVQNKRHKSENQSPASSTIFASQPQQRQALQPTLRKTVSIMNVLTSSSEMLRKNRL